MVRCWQQDEPGDSLQGLYQNQPQVAMDAYAALVRQFIQQPCGDFASLQQWLRVLQTTPDEALSPGLLLKACTLSHQLLSQSESHVLHGDLHMGNVVRHGDTFVANDPKGVIGPLAFEVAAFDFVDLDEPAPAERFQERLRYLAKRMSLDAQLLTDWVFERLSA